MLTSVALVCGRYPAVHALEQDTKAVSRFLGPSRSLSLSKACSFGCTELLDWIWESSCPTVATRTSRWSLCNYLRTDRHYYKWSFENSMKEAAGGGDLEVLEWLVAHFLDCQVPVSAVKEAAKAGQLSVLEFLWGYSSDRRQGQDDRVLKKRKTTQSYSIKLGDWAGNTAVDWANAAIQAAAEKQHFLVVRWIYDQGILDFSSPQVEIAIKRALDAGNFELAKLLLPPSRDILDYANACPRPEVIEWMLDDGRFRGDKMLALSAIKNSAQVGRLDLIKRILQQLDAPLHLYVDPWEDAMKTACRYGDLSVVQWLAENHLGPEICDSCALEDSNELVEIAAGEGHIDVLEYLCSYPLTQNYSDALEAAMQNNHLDSVKCLLKHISYTATYPDYSVVALAAGYGRLEIVQYLHGLESLDEIEGFDETKVKILLKGAWWSRAGPAMNRAAEEGHISIDKWLHEHDSTRTVGIMGDAVHYGHFELVQWLHKHRPEQCTTAAMDKAASEGHLEMVKWLHANGVGACTTAAIDRAAANGHLHVIKWLHANRSMGFTVNTLSEAVRNDHLHVACWVYRPEHAREFIHHCGARRSRVMPRAFEMVLFMQTHLPWILTPGAVKHIKKSLPAGEMHLRGWLTENYPESA